MNKLTHFNHTEPYALMDKLAEVYSKSELTPVAALIAFRLYERYGLGKTFVCISDSELARLCFVSRNTIGTQKLILKGLGLINWKQGSLKGSKVCNTYDVSGLIRFWEEHCRKNLPNNRASESDNLPKYRASTSTDLPSGWATPAQKLGTIEKIEKDYLSREDYSGEEAEHLFTSASELAEWVSRQPWGINIAPSLVSDFFAYAHEMKWCIRGRKIVSLRKTICNWKCSNGGEPASPAPTVFTQFYNC